VPNEATHEDWPEDRVWQELELRMAVGGQPSPVRGDLIERDFLDLRVRAREPMQKGRIFLAGDTAHKVTPAGGKGMNMAILDAIELAFGVGELVTEGLRLRHVRLVLGFSIGMNTWIWGEVSGVYRRPSADGPCASPCPVTPEKISRPFDSLRLSKLRAARRLIWRLACNCIRGCTIINRKQFDKIHLQSKTSH
jgi:hypothetical protein